MNPRSLLVHSFLAGAADLKRRSALLDRINVFPIMDGDTGANMVQTLAAAVDLLKDDAGEDLRSLPVAICPCLLRSAQGNSGVILSQFLAGFFEAVCAGRSVDYFGFLGAVSKGTALAYASVSDPEEGTMLTAMTDLGRILKRHGAVRDLGAHEKLERDLVAAVVRTQALMPLLSEAKVVDAGALGFSILAGSLALALPARWDEASVRARIEARKQGDDEMGIEGVSQRIDPGFLARADLQPVLARRFCVNLLIDLGQDLLPDWREPFQELGESIDMARHGELVKLHLHVDDPVAAVERAARLGEVLEQTVQDMGEQMVRARARETAVEPSAQPRFKVVSDSSMSLDLDLAREFCIDRIENLVNAHGKAIPDEDLDREELFKRMRAGHAYTTAVTSVEAIRDFVDQHLAVCEHLFYVAVGTAYTATQNLVRKVVEDHPAKERISIFDTRAASGQQGLICLAAARYARTATSRKDVEATIDRQIAACREYLVIDDLKYLSRSGRIGKVKAAVAGALSVKPIVGHGENGAITHAKVRSHAAALDEIVKRAQDHPGQGSMLVLIEYTDNLDWAQKVRDRLAAVLGENTDILFSPLSSTSAVHMGPGTWGVAVTRVKKPY